MALAETLAAGGDVLVDLDCQRADRVATLPAAAPATPIASLARRFGDTEVARSRRAVIEWLTPERDRDELRARTGSHAVLMQCLMKVRNPR